MSTVHIRQATMSDVDVILGLIAEAADWLREKKDTDQWQRPWPSPDAPRRRVIGGIQAGRTWIAWDGATPAATITVQREQDPGLPELWTWEDDGYDKTIYIHRLVVSRDYAGMGLGAALINWAGERGAEHGAKLIRIDVWTTNEGLHAYYRGQGFSFVRNHGDPGYPSGALFQREIAGHTDAALVSLVTEPPGTGGGQPRT